MPIAISGSLAFDTLFSFEGRFHEQILPERLDALSVSFLVPGMRREFGGCAGNIAYSLVQLGEKPLVVAAVGSDGKDYHSRLANWGLDTRYVVEHIGMHTAQAMIMTDRANNQITAFHPGAMSLAHEGPMPERGSTSLAIVSPNGKAAMLQHAQHFAQTQTPFVWDPGQGLPMFNGEELHAVVKLSSWVTVNDYEADMLAQRMGKSFAEISHMIQGLVITRGEAGCDVWTLGQMETVAPQKAEQVLDPTGCGDSFRAGLLYGLARDWPLAKACGLGNLIGATKIAHLGGQNHRLDVAKLLRAL